MMKRHGVSTVSYLDRLGYLNEHLIAVHCHDTTPEELKTLADQGVSLIGCPGSIGLIDGRIPPIYEFQTYGGIAGIGTDQCPPAGHNMFTQMKYAAVLGKTRNKDPTVLPSWNLLRLATIDGAKCHGLDDRIGSLEVGKRADIILLEMQKSQLLLN